MTKEQKDTLAAGVKLLLMGLGLAFSAGAMSHTLAAKEDRAEHSADIITERNARELQHVHDSAQTAVILDVVHDIACSQDPTRRYCR